jgi:hypothetical protein
MPRRRPTAGRPCRACHRSPRHRPWGRSGHRPARCRARARPRRDPCTASGSTRPPSSDRPRGTRSLPRARCRRARHGASGRCRSIVAAAPAIASPTSPRATRPAVRTFPGDPSCSRAGVIDERVRWIEYRLQRLPGDRQLVVADRCDGRRVADERRDRLRLGTGRSRRRWPAGPCRSRRCRSGSGRGHLPRQDTGQSRMGGIQRLKVADRESGMRVGRANSAEMQHIGRGMVCAELAATVTWSAPSTRRSGPRPRHRPAAAVSSSRRRATRQPR